MYRIILLSIPLFLFSVILHSQCLEGNCYNGKGIYLYQSGAKYSGHFNEGRIGNYGKLEFSDGRIYEGEWKDEMRNGKGKLQYPNGNIYMGSFKNNVRFGRGVIKFSTGDSYEGNWENDQPSGNGIYYFKAGHKYKGQFVNGKFEGFGIMTYSNGAKYEGLWKENKKHGEGSYTDAKGRNIKDTWVNGKRNEIESENPKTIKSITGNDEGTRNCNRIYCAEGYGKFKYKDGSYFLGEFKDGLPFGKGKTYYANGNLYEGYWKYNAPHGEGKMKFTSGAVYEARWNMGYPLKKINYKKDENKSLVGKKNTEYTDEVKIWAVIVGIASYNHMPTLKYTDDDAYQIYAFLKSPEGGAIPDERISLLIDEAATKENILFAIEETFGQADENDVIMMYYSGHGLPGSFLPYDYNGYHNVLDHHTIRNILEKSKAKHKVCFADACHSGSLLASRAPFNANKLETLFEGIDHSSGGTALFTSSKSEEISLETSGLRQGIFSHFLIKGLSGSADSDGNQLVTIRELYQYVFSNVKDYTSGRQHPSIAGNFDDNMPLSFVRE